MIETIKKDKKTIILIVIVLLLMILDQIFKLYSTIYLKESADTNVMLIYEESYSGAFGVGQNSVMTYIITNIVVLGVILKFFINQKDRISMSLLVVIAFILSGGLSNLIDKIFRGSIINYIKLWNLPAINLSFIFIILGWIGLAGIFAWNTYQEMRKNKEEIKIK